MTLLRQDESEAARAEGTTLFAVGVGSGAVQSTLLDIAGDDQDNVFDVSNFSELGSAL